MLQRFAQIGLVLPLLAACAGNGEGLDANGRPISSAPQPLLPELQSIQDQVFTPICTTCHAGAAAPLGFRLDASSSYAMLVGHPSVEVPSVMRVAPGQPDSSYIIQKLEGHAAVGARMPLGGPSLPQSTIDVIRQWIVDGAQPGAAALGASTAPQIRAIAPLPDERLTQPPRELLVAVDAELDVTQLEAGAVTLMRSGGDGSFSEGNEQAITQIQITVRSVAPTVLAIEVPEDSWSADRYQLRIAGQGGLALMSRAGAVIDDFVLEFDVESAQ